MAVGHPDTPSLIPPKLSNTAYMGRGKGKGVLRVFSMCRDPRRKPYWGNHFWAKSYCVDTVDLDHEIKRKYAKGQEKQEQKQEEFRFSK